MNEMVDKWTKEANTKSAVQQKNNEWMSNLLFLLENEEKMRYNGVEKQRKGREAREKE